MLPTKQPRVEPIPGYRLLDLLGRGGFGEVWKCEAPGGIFKAIKFVYASGSSTEAEECNVRQELQAVQHIKDIRHPFLLGMDRVEVVGRELLIVMELADKSLDTVLQAYQQESRVGIPRGELLKYMREAAEVLDLMNLEYGLQHLDVKPRNLFLVRGHVKVGDFGLVKSIVEREVRNRSKDAADPLSAITPLYAAPELFKGEVSERADQYSLAIVYQELLTGRLPFAGNNLRQLMLQHTSQPPGLDPLPLSDRPIIARAMAKEAAQRFASCTEFVEALVEVENRAGRATSVRRASGSRQGVTETRNVMSTSGTVHLGPAPARALPDYQFLTCINRTPLTESWEAVSAEGARCQVKFLYGLGGNGRRNEQEAIVKLQSLQHPALLPTQVVSNAPGCLILVTSLIETSLRWRFQECQAAGERGVPRDELLNYLTETAHALDELRQQHGLQHLELSPRNLLLDEHRHIHIADFGLTQLLWLPSGQPLGQLQIRYAAPELLEGRPSPHCDQYALALIFQEMLTGTHAYRGRAARAPSGVRPALGSQAASGPELGSLPPADRPLLERALDANPDKRFASCSEFIAALVAVSERRETPVSPTSETLTLPTVKPAAPTQPPQASAPRMDRTTAAPAANAQEAIAQLLADCRKWRPPKSTSHQGTGPRPDVSPMSAGTLAELHFPAPLPTQGALLKFEGFRIQWNAQVMKADDEHVVMKIMTPSIRSKDGTPSRPVILMLDVQWTAPPPPEPGQPTTDPEVRARVTAHSTVEGLDPGLLNQVSEQLVENLRDDLQGQGDRRVSDRMFWPHPVHMSFMMGATQVGNTVGCLGKDLSPTGLGLYLPTAVSSHQVRLQLTSPVDGSLVCVDGTIVRVQRCAHRLFEIGVRFA